VTGFILKYELFAGLKIFKALINADYSTAFCAGINSG
jgi:hypothetical protein